MFFNDASLSVSVSGGDDTRLLQPVLGTDVEKKFTPLKTVEVITAELLISVS